DAGMAIDGYGPKGVGEALDRLFPDVRYSVIAALAGRAGVQAVVRVGRPGVVTAGLVRLVLDGAVGGGLRECLFGDREVDRHPPRQNACASSFANLLIAVSSIEDGRTFPVP